MVLPSGENAARSAYGMGSSVSTPPSTGTVKSFEKGVSITIVDSHGRERVLAIIEKKRTGETIRVEKPKAAEVKELMVALEETVAKLGKK